MKKNVYIIITLVVIALVIFSVTKNEKKVSNNVNETEASSYSNTEFGFSLHLPVRNLKLDLIQVAL